MKFNSEYLSVFASKTKMKILKHVMKDGFSATGREIARICGISQTMAIKNLKEFEGMHLVVSKNAGKSILWSARNESYTYKILTSIINDKTKMYPKEYLIRLIRKKFVGKNIMKVILFGSVADGTERVNSDIDLFVLVSAEKDKGDIEKKAEALSLECIRLFGNPLRVHILTVKERKKLLNKNLIQNIEKGITII